MLAPLAVTSIHRAMLAWPATVAARLQSLDSQRALARNTLKLVRPYSIHPFTKVHPVGITVNALAPAVVRTAMVENMPQEQVKYMTDKIPMKR